MANLTQCALSEVQRSALRRLAEVVVRLSETHEIEGRVARFGEMLDRLHSEIYLFDASTMRFEYASAGAQRNCGYSIAELRQLTPQQLAPALNAEAFRAAIQPLITGERTYTHIESECLRKDGTTYPIEVRLQLWRDSGNPVCTAVVTDTTQRKRYEATLRSQRVAMEGAIDGMAFLDQDARYVYLNGAYAKLFGYNDPRELIGAGWRQFFDSNEIERIEREVFPRLMQDGSWSGEAIAKRRDGSTFNKSLSLTSLERGGLVCVCRDITALKATEEALFREKELTEVTLKSIGEAVITTDVKSRITSLNPIAETMTGWSNAEACGKPVDEVFRVVEATSREPTRNPVKLALTQNRIVGLARDAILVDRYGGEATIERSAAPIRDRAGQAVGAVLIFRNVSETRAMALRIAHLAQHDFLTDLPNRVLLIDRMQQAAALAQRYDKRYALLFLNLDHFKHINDSLGHEAGDRLLIQIARRLQRCVHASDTVSRQGGDEFFILLAEIADSNDAAQVTAKVLKTLVPGFVIDGQELLISTSIGIAVYPDDGHEPDALMRNADAAMCHAKQEGRNNFQFYSAGMNARARERLTLKSDLRRALANEEFVLHFQPRVDVKTRAMIGCEALIRWHSPDRGLVLPGEFIPHIEENGLIVPIGHWVLRTACRQLRAWRNAGLRLVPVSVNVSAAQFRRTDFYADVFKILAETEVQPALLEIELTESTIMHNLDATAAALHELKKLGVRISIDDFGIGYSSLSQLRRLPIDTLKIDRSFVADLTTNPDDAAITAAIVSMAKSLRQEVVAEGVETQEQLNYLMTLGCDAAQGYHFHRPLPAEAIVELMQQGGMEL